MEVPKKIIIFTYFYRIVHSKPSSFGGKPHVFGCSPWPMAHGPQVSDEEFRSIVAERRSDWAPDPRTSSGNDAGHVARDRWASKRHQVVGKDSGYSDGSLAWKSWE